MQKLVVYYEENENEKSLSKRFLDKNRESPPPKQVFTAPKHVQGWARIKIGQGIQVLIILPSSFAAICCGGGGEGGRGALSYSLHWIVGGTETNFLTVPCETISEPGFLNVYRAQESIPRNEFRQPM